MEPDRVRAFATLEETAAFLRSELGPGDLLLLKGRCDGCWELGARSVDSRRAAIVAP
jgi:hypothetical protein